MTVQCRLGKIFIIFDPETLFPGMFMDGFSNQKGLCQLN